MDGGCTVEGYASDITRTFVLGKASDKMKSVFDIVLQAQSTALATARPGQNAERSMLRLVRWSSTAVTDGL